MSLSSNVLHLEVLTVNVSIINVLYLEVTTLNVSSIKCAISRSLHSECLYHQMCYI